MAEPKMIGGAWWTQQPDGSWLRFDDAVQQWKAMPSGPPLETPTTISPPIPATPAAASPAGSDPWGEPVASPSASASGSTVVRPERPKSDFKNAPILTWFVLGAAALVVIGSMGPWATVLDIVSINGLDADGSITIVLGLIAAVTALARASGRGAWTLIVAAVSFALSGLIGIVDWADVESLADEAPGFAEVAWGLILMTMASLAGVVLSLVGLFVKPRPTRT